MVRRIALPLTFALFACGGPPGTVEPTGGDKVKVGNDGAEVALTHAGLRDYVTSGVHHSWTAEPAVHAGTQNSPHGKVRVYFNKASHDALKSGARSLPVGSMIIKDLFASDGTTVNGYAVMVKSDAARWTWWESFGTLDSAVVLAVDAPGCKGCHSGAPNSDQVRTPVP